ncbi:hypothetical protein HZA33_03365 [Candidatus Pacearchaeota archaeon]|nr:hypothetical protein [Candidatus Pacearchaeota archaeon]
MGIRRNSRMNKKEKRGFRLITYEEFAEELKGYKGYENMSTKEIIEKIRNEFKRNREDLEFYTNNHKRLRREYPDQWVAIYDKKVVGHGKDLEKLCDELTEKGIETGHTLIKRTYFKEKPPVYILEQALAY